MRSRRPRQAAPHDARGRRDLRRRLVHLCGHVAFLLLSARRTLRTHGRAHMAGGVGVPLLPTVMLFAAFGGIASAAFAVAFLWVREEHSALILPHFVSFATGALLGAALLALLPEAMERAGPAAAHGIGVALVAGLGMFFIIEKLVLW